MARRHTYGSAISLSYLAVFLHIAFIEAAHDTEISCTAFSQMSFQRGLTAKRLESGFIACIVSLAAARAARVFEASFQFSHIEGQFLSVFQLDFRRRHCISRQ